MSNASAATLIIVMAIIVIAVAAWLESYLHAAHERRQTALKALKEDVAFWNEQAAIDGRHAADMATRYGTTSSCARFWNQQAHLSACAARKAERELRRLWLK